MPKSIPDCPPVPAVHSSPGRLTHDYRIRLITPMFGGGIVPGEIDQSCPIRGTAIRGHLQFWWRATRGASSATPRDLFEKHAEVWGSPEKSSRVEVEVRNWQAADPHPCGRYEWKPQLQGGRGGYQLQWQPPFRVAPDPREDALPYVLFPFQGKPPSGPSAPESEKPPASFIKEASFTLRVRFWSDLGDDVQTAVWAWVNFGGLGARTRRGCGALRCDELAPRNFEGLPAWFRARAAGVHGQDHPWPTLPSRFLSHPEVGDPVSVWNRVIRIWRDFRQVPGFARNPGQQGRPGRSRYPEPETIREVCHADRKRSGHQRLAHIPADAFPRAELGLPIVFQFKDRGDLKDAPVLYPRVDGQRKDRMASPLILKPLALADGRAVPLVMRLRTPQLMEVELTKSDGEVLKGASQTVWGIHAIRDKRLVDPKYHDSPLRGLTEDGSALEAFLARAVQNGYKEIQR
ncbi:MAG TPA: type III-B CRISPR module RAMP protein Cmr1 [Isosphaeraceae bacterium]|nr:type III-B CRISPR module RAMP protein Cmr1 [Isosphaeraceae bacterium]